WAYMDLFGPGAKVYPKALEQRLADDPEFFGEAIGIVFRSKNDDEPTQEPAEQRRARANNVYRLLHSWKTPPGNHGNNEFVGADLKKWLESVKARAKVSGHWEVAMSITGQVLIYCPADPDGLWIHRAAADVLNDKDAEKMRSGFCTSL
ncbi:MAG: hypothetical protein ACRETA_13565, partial [Gammaproteobacteria bacterium]